VQTLPSRLAVVKNVLGGSVSIVTPWVPPAAWPAAWPGETGGTVTGPVEGHVKPTAIPDGVSLDGYWKHTFTWTITYGDRHDDPGPPFDIYTKDNGAPGQRVDEGQKADWPHVYLQDPGDPTQYVQLGSGAVEQAPVDIINAKKDKVNWGLMVYSTGLDFVPNFTGINETLGSDAARTWLVAKIRTDDSANVDHIEAALKLYRTTEARTLVQSGALEETVINGVTVRGLNAFGSTPTKDALEFAKDVLQATAQGTAAGDPLQDTMRPTANSFDLPRDPKLNCDRAYGSILVSDGTSNVGNEGGCLALAGEAWGNWAEPCWTCVPSCCDNQSPVGIDCGDPLRSAYSGGNGCPDGGPSPLTGATKCPNNWQAFAPQWADQAWLAQAIDANNDIRLLKIRTWVIGISKEVGQCELNYTAYRGRTDAYRTDAGFDTAKDPRLPPNVYTGLTEETGATNCSQAMKDGSTGHTPTATDADGNPVEADYAFFATSAQKLKAAIDKIVEHIGVGDYSTSGPSIAASTTLGSTAIGFITTGSYPGWQGHMYAYDLNSPITCDSDAQCPTVANGDGRCNINPLSPNWRTCKPPDTFKLLWDAGDVLSAYTKDNAGNPVLKPVTDPPDFTNANHGVQRKIFTWNPSLMGYGGDTAGEFDNALKEVTTANAATINAICGGCLGDETADPGITAKVVDFIQGNDGTGRPRQWALGAIMNSTAAVIAPPQQWRQFPNHDDFQSEYESRHPLAWVGSSDGMLHAFDAVDGAEIVALIPPDMLGLQKEQYDIYVEGKTAEAGPYPMGQLPSPSDHKWGIANSPRFGDVWDPTASKYRTFLFITEGPGGTGLHAIDVTHAFPGRTYPAEANCACSPPTTTCSCQDPNYGYGDPTTGPPVLSTWSYTGDGKGSTTTLATLANTWSIPALAGTSSGANWELVIGNGYVKHDPSLASTDNPTPHYLRFDPLLGDLRKDEPLAPLSGDQTLGGPWVRAQAFADSTIWSTAAGYYAPDNDVKQGVQLDLQGRVWLLDRQDMISNNWKVPVALSDPGSLIIGQPLYYSAAVATYPSANPLYDLYAFSSGSFYEVSDYLRGDQVGTPGNFIPSLYLVVQPIGGGSPVIYKKNINTVSYGLNNSLQLGHKTQITAYPTIFVPKPGSGGKAIALFLVYDPDAGTCVGNAYLVRLDFDPTTLTAEGTGAPNPNPVIQVDEAGSGAASGFALAGQIPVVAKSFVGADGRAYFYKVKNLVIPGAGGTGGGILWWRELQ
jgi:hypothetical protein